MDLCFDVHTWYTWTYMRYIPVDVSSGNETSKKIVIIINNWEERKTPRSYGMHSGDANRKQNKPYWEKNERMRILEEFMHSFFSQCASECPLRWLRQRKWTVSTIAQFTQHPSVAFTSLSWWTSLQVDTAGDQGTDTEDAWLKFTTCSHGGDVVCNCPWFCS